MDEKDKYLVAVKIGIDDKTEVYEFDTIRSAKAFMGKLNDMGLDFVFTPKGWDDETDIHGS